jgi:hypothetical protein
MQNNQASKSNLARLLATENINVQYVKTPTASFHVGTRTLTLPIITDMSNDMHDLFIGHEVGHAIFTPVEYGSVQDGMPSGFGTFLNVVEDARIERQIKDRYPGLKRSFSKGYQDFMRMDFFGVKNKNLDGLLLIDRINLHFKIGSMLNLDFNTIEQSFVDKVDACDTFDDVVRVSKEIFEYCKQEIEDKKEEMQEFAKQMAERLSGKDDDDFDDDYGDNFEDSEDFDPDYSDVGDYDPPPNEVGAYGEQVKSLTDEKLQEALKKMASSEKNLRVGNLDTDYAVDPSRLIVPFKNLVGKIYNDIGKEIVAKSPSEILAFEKKIKNSVLYMVKEFELRKKAAELRRMVISDSGVLDTNKLHTYKFNDDIFRKFGAIPAGKNHGLVIFLDWSGSMCENLRGTVEQLLTLIYFCQKIKVPYEVYAFSTEYMRWAEDREKFMGGIKVSTENNTVMINTYFNLMNLFSSRMKVSEFRTMANDLLHFANVSNFSFSRLRSNVHSFMGLGGTPLNDTIFSASRIVNLFRKEYKTEIVNVIFLTDGEDSSSLSMTGSYYSICESTIHQSSYIFDKQTKKRYQVDSKGVTPVLLNILKDRTGCNLIGFYILPKKRRDFDHALHMFGSIISDDSFKKFKEEKFYGVENYGYDEYFLIPGGKDLEVEDEDLNDLLGENNTSFNTRRLRGAFLKMNQNRVINRVLLSKVVEKIS